MSLPRPGTPERDALDASLVALLRDHSYVEAAAIAGTSVGTVHSAAVRANALRRRLAGRLSRAEKLALENSFLRENLNTTVTGDVMEVLEGIPDGSVQLVVTSFPYNRGKAYGQSTSEDCMRFGRFCGWLQMVVSELERVTAPGGTLCINLGSTEDWKGEQVPLDWLFQDFIARCGLTFVSRVVWTQPHGLTPTSRPADRYEVVLVCSKGAQATWNPTPLRTPQRDPGKRAYKGPNRGRLSGNPFGSYPSNVWTDLPSVRHNHPDRKHAAPEDGAHPAQFPVGLAMRCILAWSKPGDLVLDPFSGSGSTHEGCIRTGRAFIGADLYYEATRARRIAAARPDTVSPLPGITDESAALWAAELAVEQATTDRPTVPVWDARAVRVDTAAVPLAPEVHEALALDLFGEVA